MSENDSNEYHLARERVATRLGLKTAGTKTPNVGFDERFGWLDRTACVDLDIDDFFVPAGHAISEDTLNVCRGCPVRIDCLRHVYTHEVSNGYFGGLSPGQRRSMTFEQAVAFIQKDVRRGR
jgi:hypothetical protein